MERLRPQQPQLTFEMLENCPRDSAGMYEVGGHRLEQLERRLNNAKLLLPEPDVSRIRSGITLARQLEATDMVSERLQSFKFMSEMSCKRIIGDTVATHIWLEEPLFADPEKILGAESFSSWMGRGVYGQGEVAIRERAGKRSSYEQIVDYATRETQLPYLSADGGLNLIIQNGKSFFFSSNAHRAAAAKLRQEPLGFRCLSIYKISD